MSCDYIYSAKRDTVRVRIFKTDGGTWDFDVFIKDRPAMFAMASSVGETNATKREAKVWAEDLYGALKNIIPKGSVVAGW